MDILITLSGCVQALKASCLNNTFFQYHGSIWQFDIISTVSTTSPLEFSVGGDDVAAFFPVKVKFVGQGNSVGLRAASVTRVDNGEEVVFSVTQDSIFIPFCTVNLLLLQLK